MGRVEYYHISFGAGGDYLEDMQLRLGTFFDVGVNWCGCTGQRIAELFLDSGIARKFELRTPRYVAGMSGVELLERAFERCGAPRGVPDEPRWPTSPEYWVGYSLPRLQVSTGMGYARVFEALSFDDVRGMHYRYQDRTEDEFVQGALELIARRGGESRLQSLRKASGFTQGQLAEASRVSLRSIQLYEQGAKDINHAAADSVRRLALALSCGVEDLLQ